MILLTDTSILLSVADTLLWKDKKQSLTTLLLLVAIYNYLFANGYTMITAVAKLISVVALFLFIHGALPSKMYEFFVSSNVMIYLYYLLVSSLVSVFPVIILLYMVVCRLGYNIEKLSPSYFELSEEQARKLAHSATHIWNNGIIILRSLCKGKDWTLMFKVCRTIFC